MILRVCTDDLLSVIEIFVSYKFYDLVAAAARIVVVIWVKTRSAPEWKSGK